MSHLGNTQAGVEIAGHIKAATDAKSILRIGIDLIRAARTGGASDEMLISAEAALEKTLALLGVQT